MRMIAAYRQASFVPYRGGEAVTNGKPETKYRQRPCRVQRTEIAYAIILARFPPFDQCKPGTVEIAAAALGRRDPRNEGLSGWPRDLAAGLVERAAAGPAKTFTGTMVAAKTADFGTKPTLTSAMQMSAFRRGYCCKRSFCTGNQKFCGP